MKEMRNNIFFNSGNHQKHEEKQTYTSLKSLQLRLETDLHRPHHPLHQDKGASKGYQYTTKQQI